MALFPSLGPQFYDERDRPLLSRMEKSYSDGITLNQTFWSEADIDTRFEAGDQTLWQDFYGNLPVHQRKQFNFNRIRRTKELISGYQRRNRKSTIVVPVENGDSQTADQYTKIMMWVNNQEGILETISDAFNGALVTGMNLLQIWLDYRTDTVSGNIRVDNCSYNSFLIDPFFRKHNLSDCRYIWKRSFLTKRECISLLPDHAEDIASLSHIGTSRDGKFQFLPESYNYDMTSMLTYDEYYYRDYRTQRMLVDSQTGECMEWRSNDEDGLKQFLKFFPQITVIESEIPTVTLGIVIEGRVMYHGPNPLGIDLYPFVPVLAYYNPQMPYMADRIQGVVRGLRDAQYLYNRRKVIELDILESQINSGWKYKENALVNPKDVFLSGQGKGLALKQEAQMSDVEQIMPPGIPPSMIQLSEILGREIQEISGVNEELLGSATDDKSGILSMLRQGAGLTTLQSLFDKLDYSQKLLGKLILQIVQTNFTPGKVKKIIDEDPAPQFYNKAFGRYDAAVEEGFNTTTQKQMQFAQLLQLKDLGLPIPDDVIIEAATLQNKTKLMASVTQRAEQQRQAQAAQSQAVTRELQSRITKNEAQAVANEGLGIERLSRVQENKALAVERMAEAKKDRDIGLLNLVKAMKEIDDIDLQHIEKLLGLASILKNRTEVSPTPADFL